MTADRKPDLIDRGELLEGLRSTPAFMSHEYPPEDPERDAGYLEGVAAAISAIEQAPSLAPAGEALELACADLGRYRLEGEMLEHYLALVQEPPAPRDSTGEEA